MFLWILILLAIFMAFWMFSRHFTSRSIANRLHALHAARKHKKLKLDRKHIIRSLNKGSFDILVIGGGCVGTGCALDAATRGLKVALIEALDFGSETSSKTTKLLHGGIRYLQKVFSTGSLRQLGLVLNALTERNTVMKIAPYLTRTIRIMIPIYTIRSMPVQYILAKTYDWLSWFNSLGRSYLISARTAAVYFQNLQKTALRGAVVYHDGMMFDVRINAMLAKTAAFYGATTANYVKFVDFIKNEDGRITGVVAHDEIGNKQIRITARVVISAAGAFTDHIREKNNKKMPPIMVPSRGTHIVLAPGLGVEGMGILDTKTADDRVVFILPWNNHTIVGSTDTIGELQQQTKPSEAEIDFLLNEVCKYTDRNITRTDVTAAWTGIRPLVSKEHQNRTEAVVRSFVVMDDLNGLVVVAGGKWTTFRKMAECTVTLAIEKYQLHGVCRCLTSQIEIFGSRRYSRDLFYRIATALSVDLVYARHLQNHYGDNAFQLRKYITKYPARLSTKYLFREGEAVYCLEEEMAMCSSDVVNNRFGVGYYDVLEANEMVRKIDLLFSRHCEETGTVHRADPIASKKVLETLGYDLIKRFKCG